MANQAPLDVNGFPVDGIKLDYATCKNELVQLYDTAEEAGALSQRPNLSDPNVCSRMSMLETANWEKNHPGWYVKLVKCPHKDGTFPGDTSV